MRTPSPFASALLFVLAVAAPTPALAQAINIDFGPGASVPSPSYAAAGWAGVWNAIGVYPPGQRAPLVGLDGQPVVAQIYGIGGTAMLEVNDPSTSGDDEALLDDMLLGFNNPVDLCLWIEYLEEGEYEVTTYALTPNDPALFSPVRVDFGTPGPTPVGGAWAGQHAEGLSYVRHVVTTVNGKIGLHSGTYGAGGQAGVNALQIRPMFPVGVGGGAQVGTRLLSASPNPARAEQRIALELAASGRARVLEIADVKGRIVWRTALDAAATGASAVLWPGIDLAGRPVASGLYFARLTEAGGTAGRALRLVRVD